MALTVELQSLSPPLTETSFRLNLFLRGALRDCGIGLPLGCIPSFQGCEAVWSAQLMWEANCLSQDEGWSPQDEGVP